MINRTFEKLCIFLVFFFCGLSVYSQKTDDAAAIRPFRVMEYNVENLFDTQHDDGKDDYEFSYSGAYRWTPGKFKNKLNSVARGIVLSSMENGNLVMPDLIGLCEVENDAVMRKLTRYSVLSSLNYEYVMTDSPDARGIDVALMYSPYAFALQTSYSLRVDTLPGQHPTRDILYAKGLTPVGMMHVFVVHAPSRRGGEKESNRFREHVVGRLLQSTDSVMAQEPDANILIMGDFNAYKGEPCIEMINRKLEDVTSNAVGRNDHTVCGTYFYGNRWGSLDHIFLSDALKRRFVGTYIGDAPEMLIEADKKGVAVPRRFFTGTVSRGGYSDHLPLVVDLK